MSVTRSSRPEGGRSLFSVAQIQHVLRIEFGRAQRYRYPLVCLVLSIDQLGALRDRHGYDAKEALFEAIGHPDKEMHEIPGANHYYSGPDQRGTLRQAVGICTDWLHRQGFSL